MATRKRKAEEEVESAGIAGIADIYSAEDLNPALAALQVELGYSGDLMSKVFVTMVEGDGKEARVWNGTPDDYDIESLAKKFGSGDYRVKVMVKMPNGPFVVRGNGVIRMKLPADEDARLKMIRANPQAALAQMQPASPVITAETIAAAIKAALPPPAPNYLEVVTSLAGVMTKFMPPSTPNPAAQINPFDVVKLVVSAVADSRRGRAVNDDDDEDTPSRGRGRNQYDLWNNLIDKFAPMFNQVIVRGAGVPPQPGQVELQPPAGVEVQQPPGATPMTEHVDTPEIRQLRMGVAFLVAQADAGHDPVTYADMVLDQVPEESLRALVAMPDPVAYLMTLNPRISEQPIADWFRSMLAEVKAELDAPDEPEAPSNP